MKKRMIALVFGICIIVSGCGPKSTKETGIAKIGIMTGTVAQGEEEYRAAQKMKEKYGDAIVLTTYPDNFVKEQETTISNMLQLAADPDVKAIIMCIGITGAAAAFEKVRQMRPDLLLICGNTVEDPDMIANTVDLVIHPDEINMGRSIPEQAAAMGAKTLVHYSFPRHLAAPMYRERLELMRAECQKLGIKLVEEACPDPTGDLGISGAQLFMMEDIPKKAEIYGKDTCFFNTNCSMQEPLIKASLDAGAMVAQQCCPSPFHGYPAALGISVPPEHAGDTAYMITAITQMLKEKGAEGRFSTWDMPVNMTIIEAAVSYAQNYVKGETNGKNDKEALIAAFQEITQGSDFTFSSYTSQQSGEVLENLYLILGNYVTF